MRRSNFALRMPPALKERAEKAAESQGVALNQLINMAVAQIVSTLDAAQYFRERGRRADRQETLRILARAGLGNPPMLGDELPISRERKTISKQRRSKSKPKRGAAKG